MESLPVDKEKKRKRTLKVDSSVSAIGDGKTETKRIKSEKIQLKSIGPASADEVPLSRKLFYAEEEEVEHRDVNKDVQLFQSACDDIKRTIQEIKDMKEAKGKTSKADIESKKVEGLLQIVMLKKLNRLAHIRCKKVRDGTSEAKQRIDKCHLLVQNLLYEVMHLEKEITKCLEFKSKDEEIDLVPVEQFYNEAPAEISKPEMTENDKHQQTLARLDWELEQRKQLSEQLTEVQKKKETIETDLKTKQDHLENLQPKLSTILQSTKPVQEYLKMPFDAIREEHQTAQYLPHPLYVLYMQTSAYKEACDERLTVTLEGDVDAAKSIDMSSPLLLDEESDSDQEEQEEQDKKASKRRRKTVDVRKTDSKNKILTKHPLSVVLNVACKDGNALNLTCNYLTYLKVITVEVKVTLKADVASNSLSGSGHPSKYRPLTALLNSTYRVCTCSDFCKELARHRDRNKYLYTQTATITLVVRPTEESDLLSPEMILNDLYSGDHGNTSPNHSNQYDLARFGLKDFSSYLSQLGRPYMWAQWLGGLQFLNGEAPRSPQSSVSSSNMQTTIKKLRNRVKSRLSLLKQLVSLERKTIFISSEYQQLFPAKLCAQLTSWKRSTYAEYIECPYSQAVVELGVCREIDLYFTAVIERASAKLTAQIIVAPDYPVVAPLFCINIDWSTNRNSRTDSHIQEMEEEVNIHYNELVTKSHDQLLSNQLQRLVMCFDVYLETEAQNVTKEGPVEIAKEKVFTRLSRGPQRSKPYKYCPDTGIFTHR